MDAQTVSAVAHILEALGPWGLVLVVLGTNLAVPCVVLVLWFFNSRRVDRLLQTYREDVQKTLGAYRASVDEIAQYYKDNVELVKSWERLADDITGIVSLNTRTMQRLVDRVESNWFCPAVKKEAQP